MVLTYNDKQQQLIGDWACITIVYCVARLLTCGMDGIDGEWRT